MTKIKLSEEEISKINDGAGRYDVVDKGEAWSDGGDSLSIKHK